MTRPKGCAVPCERSSYGTMVTVAADALFVLFGSTPNMVAVTVLLMVAALLVRPVIVMVACAPVAMRPRLQVAVTMPWQKPCDEVAETNLIDGGNVSERITSVAAFGPLFLTVTL